VSNEIMVVFLLCHVMVKKVYQSQTTKKAEFKCYRTPSIYCQQTHT